MRFPVTQVDSLHRECLNTQSRVHAVARTIRFAPMTASFAAPTTVTNAVRHSRCSTSIESATNRGWTRNGGRREPVSDTPVRYYHRASCACPSAQRAGRGQKYAPHKRFGVNAGRRRNGASVVQWHISRHRVSSCWMRHREIRLMRAYVICAARSRRRNWTFFRQKPLQPPPSFQRSRRSTD